MTSATTTKAAADPVEYSDHEAAKYLGGVEVLWLQRRARAGEISHTKVGRTYRFSRADLDTYLARQRRDVAIPPQRRTTVAGISPATAARARGRNRRT